MSIATPVINTLPLVIPTETLPWMVESLSANGPAPSATTRGFDYPDLGGLNIVQDFHGQVRNFDLLGSGAGNFNAMQDELFRRRILPTFPAIAGGTWGYTTSPPRAVQQIQNGRIAMGNIEWVGTPHVVYGPGSLMNSIEAAGWAEGARAKILSNFGNVFIVRKGNPLNIQSVFDLGKWYVRLATSNPQEAGSFANYNSTIHNVAFWEAYGQTNDVAYSLQQADDLFNSIFNHPSNGNPFFSKWVTHETIMHRGTPELVANSILDGNAGVGILFYHLAKTAINRVEGGNDLFEIIPIGGTVEDPQPALGNRVATMNAIRINQATGGFTAQQMQNGLDYFNMLTDPVGNEALGILSNNWVREPVSGLPGGNNQPPLP